MVAEQVITELINPDPFSVELNWDGNEGNFNEADYLIEYHNLCITFDLNINAISGIDYGDRLTPPSYWIKDSSIDISCIRIIGEDHEISLTSSEHDALVDHFKSKIEIA